MRRCVWCLGPLHAALGVYLEIVARGRLMCGGCGRFENRCTCLVPDL